MKTVNISISKEELAKLPAASFAGTIKVVDDVNEVDAAISELRKAPVIGFDTETRPSFKKGQNHQVALVQLSDEQTCYLFRINKCGLAPAIVSLLEDPTVLKVGLSTHDDFHNLGKLRPLEPAGFIELQDFVKRYGIADNSLTKIHGIVLGQRVSKGQRLTNWEAETLTPQQQGYAALDAQACVRLYTCLKQRKFDPAKSPYIKQPDTTDL